MPVCTSQKPNFPVSVSNPVNNLLTNLLANEKASIKCIYAAESILREAKFNLVNK